MWNTLDIMLIALVQQIIITMDYFISVSKLNTYNSMNNCLIFGAKMNLCLHCLNDFIFVMGLFTLETELQDRGASSIWVIISEHQGIGIWYLDFQIFSIKHQFKTYSLT